MDFDTADSVRRRVLELVRRPGGATDQELMEASGLGADEVRPFVEGALHLERIAKATSKEPDPPAPKIM